MRKAIPEWGLGIYGKSVYRSLNFAVNQPKTALIKNKVSIQKNPNKSGLKGFPILFLLFR